MVIFIIKHCCHRITFKLCGRITVIAPLSATCLHLFPPICQGLVVLVVPVGNGCWGDMRMNEVKLWVRVPFEASALTDLITDAQRMTDESHRKMWIINSTSSVFLASCSALRFFFCHPCLPLSVPFHGSTFSHLLPVMFPSPPAPLPLPVCLLTPFLSLFLSSTSSPSSFFFHALSWAHCQFPFSSHAVIKSGAIPNSSNRAHSSNQCVTLFDTVWLWMPCYISQPDALPFP